MNEEIKAVADRLIGLREIMDVSLEEAAKVCRISIEQYKIYESYELSLEKRFQVLEELAVET